MSWNAGTLMFQGLQHFGVIEALRGLEPENQASKAIPINELTGGPQPPILGASESSTPPELGSGGLR